MADILPPAPVDAPFGGYAWADWYKKVRDAINTATSVVWGSITGTPTTLAGYGITDAHDTTEDIIIDTTAKGLVLKSPNAHYWRVSISNAGVLTWTDLGTTKP